MAEGILLPVNVFFDELGERFVRAAGRRGVSIPPPTLDAAVAQEILELARVSAHTQERRFAPLASYLCGVAAERLRAAGGPSDPESVAALVREVWQEAEAAAGAREV